jgi:hypothetical protein
MERGMSRMKWITSVRFWIAFALFSIFIGTILYIGDYNKQKVSAEQPLSSPVLYKLMSTEPLLVPLSSSSEEKLLIKGMVITEASSHDELVKIANDIKNKYALKHVDSIELTVHNKNNGLYEEESMLYEPISKGTISIAYTPLGHKELKMPKTQNVIVKLNN